MQRKIVVNSKGIEFDVPESYDHQAYGLKLKEAPVEISAVQVIVSGVSSSDASAGTPFPVKESDPKTIKSKKVTPKSPKNETKA